MYVITRRGIYRLRKVQNRQTDRSLPPPDGEAGLMKDVNEGSVEKLCLLIFMSPAVYLPPLAATQTKLVGHKLLIYV